MPGESVSPHLSQIPLIDMHHAALVGGVPLMSIEEIKETPDVSPDFDCSPALAAAVNNFFDHCGIKSSAKGKDGVTAVLRAHTLQYLQWRDGLLRPGRLLENRALLQGGAPEDRPGATGGSPQGFHRAACRSARLGPGHRCRRGDAGCVGESESRRRCPCSALREAGAPGLWMPKRPCAKRSALAPHCHPQCST